MICKICGKKADSEYCFQHKPRKKIYSKPITKELIEKCYEDTVQMREFFLSIWAKRLHYSEVSSTFLGGEPLTVFFHHILSKEKYPELKFEEENIILLTFDEHTNIESNIYKYEVINDRREYLKRKFNL